MKNCRSIRVAYRPPGAIFEKDRFFYGDHLHYIGNASHWLEPTKYLATHGRFSGIDFHTDDMVDLRDADVFVFGELPPSLHAVRDLRSLHPQIKIVLTIVESPLGRAWAFDPANHRDFDAVISYNSMLKHGENYFSFNIPAGGLDDFAASEGIAWEARKIACLIAHVPNVAPPIIRRSGLEMIRRGWKFTPRTWWNYVTEGGSLYAERLKVARCCEDVLGDEFDIFGPGWPSQDGGVDHKNGFACARGAYAGSKLELLPRYRFTIAYENCLNDCGYITEKLFDAFLSGCVPVYLGNLSVLKYVPKGAFVDARDFKTPTDLAMFLKSMPKNQWRQMKEMGAEFMRHDAQIIFGSLQYARSMIRAVEFAFSR